MAVGALDGVRVIELSQRAGAVTGFILASLGAEVIKVEPPEGEAGRRIEPRGRLPNGEDVSYFWLAYNAGKRSVAIDLSTDAGRADFIALTATADIVVTDYERFSLAENDALAAGARARNPDLVWAEIWPFGRGTAADAHPAGDLTVQALGGHLYLNGDEDRPPVRIGLPVAISQGGAEAASAALMAYYHRLRGNGGQRVDVSMQECITWTLLNTTMTTQLIPREERRGGAVRKERANTFYTRLVWPCSDGFIFFGPVGGGGGSAREKSYAGLVAWMVEEGHDHPVLHARDWNGSDQASISQDEYDTVARVIGEFVVGKTQRELVERAVRDRILLAPISDIPHILANPQLRARDYFKVIEDPGRGTAFEYPLHWANLTGTPLVELGPAPIVDADGDALRAEITRQSEVSA